MKDCHYADRLNTHAIVMQASRTTCDLRSLTAMTKAGSRARNWCWKSSWSAAPFITSARNIFNCQHTSRGNDISDTKSLFRNSLLLLLLLLLGRRQSTPDGFLSPANPVIHHCRQAVSGDPGVCIQQIDKCANLFFDGHFATLRFPQNQIANNFIFTPPAMTAEPKVPLSNCGRDPR